MSGCTGLTGELNLSGLSSHTAVTDMSYFLAGCPNITNVNFSVLKNIKGVTILDGFLQFNGMEEIDMSDLMFSKVTSAVDMMKNDVNHFKTKKIDFGWFNIGYGDLTIDNLGDFLDDGSGLMLQNTKVLTEVVITYYAILKTDMEAAAADVQSYLIGLGGTSLTDISYSLSSSATMTYTLTY